MNETESDARSGFLSDRISAACAALVGAVLLVAVYQLPTEPLFGWIPFHRVFFVVNFIACALLVLGLAAVAAPKVFIEFHERRRSRRMTAGRVFVVGTAFLAVLLAMASFMFRLFFN